jgi:DNA polymerase-1
MGGAALQTFKERYPDIARWHRDGYSADDRAELAPSRTLAGRRRCKFKRIGDWFNHGIQGSAADGAKLALALLYEHRDRVPSMVPILFVHDEIVAECDETEVEAAKELLEWVMRTGMGAVIIKSGPPVPIVVEAEVRDSWAKS